MAVGITVTETQAPATTGYLSTNLKMAKISKFDDLVIALKDALGPSSGLTSDDVDLEQLTQLMADYASDEQEWSRYAMGDKALPYTRNLVDEGNGKSNLVSQPSPHQSHLMLRRYSIQLCVSVLLLPSSALTEVNNEIARSRLVARQGQSDPRPR